MTDLGGELEGFRDHCYNTEQGQVAELIDRAVTALRWVPVTEKLPEQDITVLVQMPDENEWSAEPIYYTTDSHDGDDWGLVMSENITHWRYIEPPKEN